MMSLFFLSFRLGRIRGVRSWRASDGLPLLLHEFSKLMPEIGIFIGFFILGLYFFILDTHLLLILHKRLNSSKVIPVLMT